MQEPVVQNPENGGQGGNPPEKVTKKASEIAVELQEAKHHLYGLVNLLPEPKNQNIKKKLDDANEALHAFSEGNLVRQIEEQQKQLKEEILAEANLQDKQQKERANNALQNYFNKRSELAKARQQEMNQEDQQMIDAATYVISMFDTPGEIRKDAMQEADQKKQGEILNKVLSELGNKHNHIHRTDGLFFKTKHIVKLENGMYTSESPVDLAMTVKAHGHNDFEFSTGSTENGGWVLRQSIKEMLKVGIKDISLTKELREKMYTPRRANSFGDAFLEGRRTLNYFQMEELKQLERICSASRSAYYDIKGNNIFDENGELIADAKCKPAIVHQANTFMRLTTDADRLAYLEILFPVKKEIEFNRFVTELESRDPKITLDGLSPKEYFEQKMMWRWSRNSFNAEYKAREILTEFNKDSFSSEDRKNMYLEAKEAELLSAYARSNKFSDDDRIELVKTILNIEKADVNYLRDSLTPLVQQFKPGKEKLLAESLKEFLKVHNHYGCNKEKNAAINLVRGLFDNAEAKELLNPAALFKEHYQNQPNTAEKASALLERIQCLISEKPANLFQGWMFNRNFDAEMKDLLFTGNKPNDDTADIIDALKDDQHVAQGSELEAYVQRLEDLLPKANASAQSTNSSWPSIFSTRERQFSDTEDGTELTDFMSHSREYGSDEEQREEAPLIKVN